MVVYEKKYFEAYTNDQYIWHKNNIATIILYIRESQATLEFFQWT